MNGEYSRGVGALGLGEILVLVLRGHLLSPWVSSHCRPLSIGLSVVVLRVSLPESASAPYHPCFSLI